MTGKLPRKILVSFLLCLCVIFAAFLGYVNFSPNSSLTVPQPSPPNTQNFVHLQRGDGQKIIAGKYCSEFLIKIQQHLDESKMADKLADSKLTVDINKDGKVDFLDIDQVIKKIEDEKWCRKNLE